MKYQKLIGQEIIKDIEFIRPVRGIVSMIDDRIINIEVLGFYSSNSTNGHRFLGKSEIKIESALQYESQLFDLGKVIVNFEERRERINRSVINICDQESCESIVEIIFLTRSRPYVNGQQLSFATLTVNFYRFPKSA